MNIGERIKYLRKNVLKLSQSDFGSKIGISRSNIGNIESGRVNVTDRNIADICEKYNVVEDWLRNGNGGDENIFHSDLEEDEITKYVLETCEDKAMVNTLIKYAHLSSSKRKIIDELLNVLLIQQEEGE